MTLITGLVLAAGTALAVHDLEFQLDGDTSPAAQNNPNDPAAAPEFDWDDIFTATGGNTSVVNPSGGNGDFTAASFKRDFSSKATKNGACSDTSTTNTIFCTADTSTFATGSKDILNIPDWQCNKDNNVNSKIDIMNAYAAQYQAADGDRLMYFGLEKNVDNGNNNVAFWFLKDGTVDCSSAGGAVDFTGTHKDGDVLVVSAFTNGGGVSNIDAYRWNETDSCIDNPDEPGACDDLPIASGGDCKAAPLLDDICATTNSGADEENDDITTKWKTANGAAVGNTVVPPDFFEGGINLTETLGGTACFSTFIADTRSSQSLEATLFDFARGRLGGCATTLTTKVGLSATPITGEVAPPTSIGGGSVSSGTDTATLVITGSQTWGGTLTFYLCGPDGTLTTCDQTKGVEVTETTVSNASPATAFVSGTATLTSAGTYCWSAHFEPDQASKDAGIGADDDQTGALECFTVAKVTPQLSTSAGADVTLGQAVTDTATLSGAAKEPGTNGGNTNYPSINATNGAYAGTITFTLKGPSTSGCGSNATGTGTNPQTVNVDTAIGNKSYGPVSFTPSQVGNFHWQATYTNTGSANNTSPVAHNANCDDTAEDVTVTGSAAFNTQQNWLPNDSATVTAPAGTTLNGTLTFTLYGTANCSGTALYTESFTITNGDQAGETRATTNGSVPATTYVATAGGTFTWLVSYNDTALNDPANSCKEDSTLTIDNTTDPTT